MEDFEWFVLVTATFMEFWNKGDAKKVADLFSEHAIVYDDDAGEVVVGIQDIEDYLSIMFELAKARGSSQIQLQNETVSADGEYAMERGTYDWSNMHRGRYLTKWKHYSNGWRILAHYFTIEEILAESPIQIQNTKENQSM